MGEEADLRSPRRVLRLSDRDYPPLLAALPDAPDRLYVCGDSTLLTGPSVAIVGARKATGLGLAMGEHLAAGLAEKGIVVVSGCAVGIDGAAHRGALKVGGPTVAILAGGLDVAVPPSNRKLAETIARVGCLAGEHPDGTPPMAYHFPQRNRIIAGIARVVVVVEAAAKSGALITARLALAAGREVMAVPGHPMLPAVAGSNALLADGARPALGVADVLEELWALPPLRAGLEGRARNRSAVSTDAAPVRREAMPPRHGEGVTRRLLAALSEAPETAEALAGSLGAPLSDVLAAITELEILGLARAHPGSRFSRAVAR